MDTFQTITLLSIDPDIKTALSRDHAMSNISSRWPLIDIKNMYNFVSLSKQWGLRFYRNVLKEYQFSLFSYSSLSKVFWFFISFSFHRNITASSPAEASNLPSLFHLSILTDFVCRFKLAMKFTSIPIFELTILTFSTGIIDFSSGLFSLTSQSFYNLSLNCNSVLLMDIKRGLLTHSNFACYTSCSEFIFYTRVKGACIDWVSLMPRYFRCE